MFRRCFPVLCMLVFVCPLNGQAAETEPAAITNQALTSQPVLGTIGIDSSGALTTIQSATEGTWLGGWNLSINDTVVPGKIGDFDGDGLADFVIRSNWGIGIIGNDRNDNLEAKALTQFGTDIGKNWILSRGDKVVAVGRFGSDSNPAQMVVKGTKGFAFVRTYRRNQQVEGELQVVTVVPYDTQIEGGGHKWRVRSKDKIIGVGRLNGEADSLVVASRWGMGVWVPTGSSAAPRLLSIHKNHTTFQDSNGRTWELDTTDRRFRFLGASDIDEASDKRAELVLVSSSGLAILHKKGSGVSGESFDLYFALKDGEPFPGTSVNSTLHWLVKMTDFNNRGGADLLFQTEAGITVLEKKPDSWDFIVLADHIYGRWIGGWNFNGADLLAPFAGDFEEDGRGQRDFVITSNWGIGLLTKNGTGFKSIDLTPYDSLPIKGAERLVGIGRFDHSGQRRLLFKNIPDPVKPTKPAVLTYHNDNGRTGLNDQETVMTPEEIRKRGMHLKYINNLNGPIGCEKDALPSLEPWRRPEIELRDRHPCELVQSQVLYVPDLRIKGRFDREPTLQDVFFVATDRNYLHYWEADDGTFLGAQQFGDLADPSARPNPRGIGSTPVIDYDKKLMYLVYATQNVKHMVPPVAPFDDLAYWLIAWDMQQERIVRSVRIEGSYPMTKPPSHSLDGTPVSEEYTKTCGSEICAINAAGKPDPANCPPPDGKVVEFTQDASALNEFRPKWHGQRPALLLSKGSVYVAFAGSAEFQAEFHGWVFRYDASSFEPLGVFNTTPNEVCFLHAGKKQLTIGGGIWQGGSGPAADELGQVYVMTGNGLADKTRSAFGNSFVKLAPRGYTLQLAAEPFTPKNESLLRDQDLDLGGGGPLLVPGSSRVIGGGKEGIYYVLDQFTFLPVQPPIQAYRSLYDPQWQMKPGPIGYPHLHGSPAFWRGPEPEYGYLYQQSELDVLKAYRYHFSSGRLDQEPIAVAKECEQFDPARPESCRSWGITAPMIHPSDPTHPNLGYYMKNQLSVSSAGVLRGTGVVWATLEQKLPGKKGDISEIDPKIGHPKVNYRLAAFDAEPDASGTLRLLWQTDIRDLPKWGPPTVADGKVFIANEANEVRVYELCPPLDVPNRPDDCRVAPPPPPPPPPVQLPDLVLENRCDGNRVLFVVRNNGATGALDTTANVTVLLTKPDGTDTLWVGNKAVGPLSPGEDTGEDSSFSYTPDDSRFGSCKSPPEGASCSVQGQVDQRRVVRESNEANNSLGPTDPFLCGS